MDLLNPLQPLKVFPGRYRQGLSAAERDTLARLLGRIVQDNEVPVVFMEPDEGTPTARKN